MKIVDQILEKLALFSDKAVAICAICLAMTTHDRTSDGMYECVDNVYASEKSAIRGVRRESMTGNEKVDA